MYILIRTEEKAPASWSHEAILVKITTHLNSFIKLREGHCPKLLNYLNKGELVIDSKTWQTIHTLNSISFSYDSTSDP